MLNAFIEPESDYLNARIRHPKYSTLLRMALHTLNPNAQTRKLVFPGALKHPLTRGPLGPEPQDLISSEENNNH